MRRFARGLRDPRPLYRVVQGLIVAMGRSRKTLPSAATKKHRGGKVLASPGGRLTTVAGRSSQPLHTSGWVVDGGGIFELF